MTDGTPADAVDIGQQGENGGDPNININDNATATTTTSSSPPLDSQPLPDVPQKEQDESTLPESPASFTQPPPVPIVATPKETLEAALQEFVRQETKQSSDYLQEILEGIATSGLSRFVWDDLKVLLSYQLTQVVQRYEDASTPENLELYTKISKLLNDYTEAPFTLQRITELATRPQRFYRTARKLLNALEKLVSVSTTIPVWDGKPIEDTGDDEQRDELRSSLTPEAVFVDDAAVLENVPVPMELETDS